MQKVIACCFDGCPEGAICSIQTKTGRANVCMAHYPKVERGGPQSNSPFVQECGAPYKKSYAYRQKHGGEKPAPEDRSLLDAELEAFGRRMEASQPARQPGQDDEELPLGIARDPLEQEFMDRAQP